MIEASHPILSCEEAKRFEAGWFGGDEEKEWGAMQRAGGSIGLAVLNDAREMGGLTQCGQILVLVGKGHNGGDALIAAETILEHLPDARAHIVFVFGVRVLRPLASRAWQILAQRFGDRVTDTSATKLAESYELCLDGIFGFQFRPPVDAAVQELIDRVNALSIRCRAAVDLPSAGIYRADFTYATGAVKRPALESENTGRLRYLDLGFFPGEAEGRERVLTSRILEPLTTLRSPQSDKRSQGHLYVLAGSRSFPGAVMMTVLAALRSGVGLVTAFIPESLVPAYAARVPEAIWVGFPETPEGGLALEGMSLLRGKMDRASAWVIGPGIAREAETLTLVKELVRMVGVPVLLDADALQREIINEAKSPMIVTPHAGEFARIAGTATIETFAAISGVVVVLKGPVTRIAAGEKPTPERSESEPAPAIVYHSLFGGPVLARGGSGDLLAGMIGSLLAQAPNDPLLAAARGAVWHGMAADFLARSQGQVAVNTTQLLDFLPAALRAV